MAKMDWYVEDLINGKRPFVIKDSGKNYGTVCMPTGTGKSAVIFDDLISEMIKAAETKKKAILSLSAPILKLKNQTISDFLEIISNPKTLKWLEEKGVDASTNNLCLVNNSSYIYKETDNRYGYEVYSFKSDFETAIELYGIILLDNCLRSFGKYLPKLKKLPRDFTVANYFDESHKVNIDNKDIEKVQDDSGDDDCVSYVDIDTLLEYSTKVVSISATPHTDLIEKLNNKEGVSFKEQFGIDNAKRFIYLETPSEAFKKGSIIPPEPTIIVQTEQSDEGKVDTESLEQVFADTRAQHPEIYSKILVNCRYIKQIQELDQELRDAGYKVFFTYSGIDRSDFVSEVDSYEGDCFILHCKQLIAGIDINSITDTVQYVGSHQQTKKLDEDEGNISLYRETPIQTIGRSMRSFRGERGMEISKRKKKAAGAYFICKENNFEAVKYAVKDLWCRYYQVGIINFRFFRSKNGEWKEDRETTPKERAQRELTAEYLRTAKIDFNFTDEVASYMEYRGILTDASILEEVQNILNEKALILNERIMRGQQFLTGTEEWKENIVEILPTELKRFIANLQNNPRKNIYCTYDEN